MPGPATVEEYLESLSEERRLRIKQLLGTIAAAAPEATQQISYRMPAFRSHGQFLVSCEAYKKHDSLFPASDAVIDGIGEELTPYLSGKGTIRFQADVPLPLDLVTRIVRIRLGENAARAGADPQRARQ